MRSAHCTVALLAFALLAAPGHAQQVPRDLPVDFTVFEIYRVANGKIAEGWAQLDAMGLMQQLGAMPASS